MRGLGFPPGMGIGAALPVSGVLCVGAGELKPNWMPGLVPPTVPPLGAKLFGPLEAIVTELCRECATVGTAEDAADLPLPFPFTGAGEAAWAFCEEVVEAVAAEEEPTTTLGWEADAAAVALIFDAPAPEADELAEGVESLIAADIFCCPAGDVIWENYFLDS